MEYKILESKRIDNLEDEVKKYLEDGYIPLGGIAIYQHDVYIDASSHTGALRSFEPRNKFTQTMFKADNILRKEI